MRFLDTNVLVYSVLKPHTSLSEKDLHLVIRSQSIMRRVQDGEKVLSSVVHLSEFVNIMQARSGVDRACEMLHGLLSLGTISFATVEQSHYELAVEIARESSTSVNDCVAFFLMIQNGIEEIYSFDRDFDRLGVKRIT